MTRRLLSAAVLAALALAAWHLPGMLRRLDNEAAAAHVRSRQLPAASLFGIDPRVFDRAARLLPPNAVFSVAKPKRADLAALAFPNLAALALLPRRHTEDTRLARWVIAYRVDPRSLGLRVRRVVRLAPDVELVEVAR